MICPKCNTENSNGSTICIRCGSPLINSHMMNNQVNSINPNTTSNNNPANNIYGAYNNVSGNVPNSTYSNNTTNNYTNNSTNKIDKKVIYMGLAIVAVIAIVAFILYAFVFNSDGAKEKKLLNETFDPNKPIIIEENDKYGYITTKGKMMIEPQYNSATPFNGDYAVVTVDNPDKSDTYFDEVYKIIDKKGKSQYQKDLLVKPNYYPEYGIWVIDSKLYNSKLKPILKDENIDVSYIGEGYLEYHNYITNECGIMNSKGKSILKWNGISISADIESNKYDEKELYALVRSYDDPEKEVIVSLKNGKTLYTLEDPENYNLTSEENGLFSAYNRNDYNTEIWLYFVDNKLAYESQDKDIDDVEIYDYDKQILEIDYGYNYASHGKKQRYYYYEVKSKKMLTEKPIIDKTDKDIDLMELAYGYRKFESSSKYGLIKDDKIVLQAEYDDLDFVSAPLYKYMKNKKKQELVLVEKDDQTLLMNVKKQKVLATFDTTSVTSKNDSTFLKASLYGENKYTTTGYLIYNVLSGKSLTIDKDATSSINSNYITVTEDSKTTYYNTKLEPIYVIEK